MNKFLINIAGVVLFCISGFAFAGDLPPTDSISMSTVLKNLQTKGYIAIHEVEFDDGMFEAKVVDAKGQFFKVKVNPTSGEITTNKDSAPVKLSMLDAVKKAESAGYQRIAKIESHRDGYKLKAVDKNNKEVELKINAMTGAIDAKSDD